MIKYFLFLIFFVSIECYGQTKGYSENDVYSLFKRSILQNEKVKIKILSNPWLICNTDSTFYRNDTIKVFSNSYYSDSLNCCQYIAWTFYAKDKFVSTNLEYCNEPTTASATKDKDYLNILVVSKKNYLFISIFNNDRLKDSFKLISIDKIKKGNSNLTSTILILVRQKFE